MELKPTMLQERIATLDILRGISLVGILLVNMYTFYLPMPHIDLASWFTTPSDIVWQKNIDIYVQGAFTRFCHAIWLWASHAVAKGSKSSTKLLYAGAS